MKIFIYHNLIDNPAIREYNTYLANLMRLNHQYQYLEHFYHYFKRYETVDAREADYFFIPWFLTGWQFANLDPIEFINLCPFLHKGNHIFVATGDFGQRAETRHEPKNPGRAYEKKYPWLDERFILLALESTPTLLPQDIGFLPYPIQPIPEPTGIRDLYLTFMGKLKHQVLPPDHMRGGRLLTFRAGNTNPDIIIGTPEELQEKFGKDITYHSIMARSYFTLCPAGCGRWTFRLNEALLNGSIPVILADDYIMPYGDTINWSDYCIFVPEKDFFEIDLILKNLEFIKVYSILQNIRKDRHLFEMAFTLSQVSSILENRLKSRNRRHEICMEVEQG